MIGIDQFKDYNDYYGRRAGDECLREVARTIQGFLRRAGDLGARYGSEEIAVLLPGLDEPDASAFVEKMRLAVRGLTLRHMRSSHGMVTLSAGVAGRVPGRDLSAMQVMIEDADAALYLAKATGGDSVATCPLPVMPAGAAAGTDALEIRYAV